MQIAQFTTISPRFCTQKSDLETLQNANKTEKDANQPEENPTTHHNEPQNPKTAFIHSQLAQPPLLTYGQPTNPPPTNSHKLK
jgi:hypothetical protein